MYRPSSSSPETIAVIISPAPLAKAIRVASATELGILRTSASLARQGETKSSTT